MVYGKIRAMKTSVDKPSKQIELLLQKQAKQGLTASEKDILITLQQARLDFLEEQFRLAQHKLFASKNEAHPGQDDLFNEVEEIAELEQEKADSEDEPPTDKKKRTRNTKLFAEHIDREVIIHDIDEADKVCGCCQGEMHCMGKDVTEKLVFVPATTKIEEHHRLKYACRGCEQHGTKTPIKQAPPVASILPKSYATPSLLAQLIIAKYQHGLPLYRQEVIFKQLGIHLSRQTMSDWLIKIANVLHPILYEYWHKTLLQQAVIKADETPLKVIKDDNIKSYMWVYSSGADSPAGNINDDSAPNIVMYDYQPTRAGKCAVDFLQDDNQQHYTGYLQVDGYAGYHQLSCTLVVCMAHIRRKFKEALKAQSKTSKKTGKADWALNHIQKLYRIEKQIEALPIEARYQIRQEKSVPLLKQFKTWLDKSAPNVVPESLLGKALNYALNQWDKAIRYCDDGRLDIDNNRSERAIKPFVMGRRAWLFSQTANGANASVTLYSIVETAKANGLIPYDYLMHVMDKIMHGQTDSEQRAPWNVKIG
jgi:transposase